MITTLQNKLFQFDTLKGEKNVTYLFYLCSDIKKLVSKITEKKCLHLLTTKEQKIIEEVNFFYNNNKPIVMLGY